MCDKETMDISVPMENSSTEMIFQGAPQWALFMNKKLDMVLSEMRDKMTVHNEDIAKTVRLAKDAKDLALEARDHADELENRILKLEKENASLKGKLIDQENRSRRNNLRIDGIKERPEETDDSLHLALDDLIGEHLQVVRIHRIGKGRNGKPRTLLVCFATHSSRQVVWDARKKLRDKGIQVREDFAKETEEIRTKLYPYLKAARADDKRCTLRVDKLLIEGKEYDLNNVSDLNIDVDKVQYTRSKDNIILFYGKNSPLSNFHPSSFNIDGQSFNCNEQFFQYHKCITHGDHQTADRVLATTDPALQKKLGNRVKEQRKGGSEKWANIMHEVMYKALWRNLNKTHPSEPS